MLNKHVLFLIFLCIPLCHFAQLEDAWVYLTDKQNIVQSLSNPISILSQKAIDRKNAHGVAIDERDVPVNENYISQLKNQTGITVLAKSKWFNAVHVRGTETYISALTGLNFVDAIDFANKNLATLKSHQQKRESKLESVATTFIYGSASNQIEMIKGNELHLADYTGNGMTIAVLDSGFPDVINMASFERLKNAGHILGGYDFVNRDNDVFINTTSSHGTWVLSTMAGYIENQFVGTAPDASYYLFITENALSENPVEESYWVEAAERADSLGVDIINTSLGYSDYDNPNYSHSSSDLDGNTTFITKGANIAFEKGMLLVTSAGNSGLNGVSAPADASGVFTVGAVNSSGIYASFSSIGSTIQPTQKPDVVAQGAASVLIREDDVIVTANGTSFSSPILAGGLACLWQALPNKTNAEIMQLVRESASQFSSPDYYLGYGIPDLQLALNTALSTPNIQNTDLKIDIFPNPAFDKLNIIVSSNEEIVSLRIFDILGKEIKIVNLTNPRSQIDISNLNRGLYILELTSQSFQKIFKLVKN
jgi:subtilisin family serine protease